MLRSLRYRDGKGGFVRSARCPRRKRCPVGDSVSQRGCGGLKCCAAPTRRDAIRCPGNAVSIRLSACADWWCRHQRSGKRAAAGFHRFCRGSRKRRVGFPLICSLVPLKEAGVETGVRLILTYVESAVSAATCSCIALVLSRTSFSRLSSVISSFENPYWRHLFAPGEYPSTMQIKSERTRRCVARFANGSMNKQSMILPFN